MRNHNEENLSFFVISIRPHLGHSTVIISCSSSPSKSFSSSFISILLIFLLLLNFLKHFGWEFFCAAKIHKKRRG
ncbi:unnamed protein product [Meloidogyne enterolobii]|uniref:Uncharacterized protein n=1 Tax=Meloidogyne enterolobii TaxID=390850 RepID=A0ACB0YQW6_MELEN